jgi:hypothetical protein
MFSLESHKLSPLPGYKRETRHVLTRVTKGIDADGGIWENILYQVICINFFHLNNKYRYQKQYLIFLSTILELYSEIAVSRKPFGIGHMYIYTFLLRMTDTVTSQNIKIS